MITTDLHTNTRTALDQALQAKFAALNKWALNPDPNDTNRREYERASAQVVFLMGQSSARQFVAS